MIADSVVGLSADNSQNKSGHGPVKSGAMWIISTVYAQSASDSPPWVSSNGQSDSLGTYFVGSYTDTLLEKATKGSLEQAIDRAVERYQLDHPEAKDPLVQSQLRSLIMQLAPITDTWIEHNNSVYTYFTRLRASKQLSAIVLTPSVPSSQEDKCTSTKLGNGRSLRFDLGHNPVYVYLSSQHVHLNNTTDTADIFVTDTNPETLRSKRGIPSRLSEIGQLHPESTLKIAFADGQSQPVKISGEPFVITVKTHYVLHYALVTACAND